MAQTPAENGRTEEKAENTERKMKGEAALWDITCTNKNNMHNPTDASKNRHKNCTYSTYPKQSPYNYVRDRHDSVTRNSLRVTS